MSSCVPRERGRCRVGLRTALLIVGVLSIGTACRRSGEPYVVVWLGGDVHLGAGHADVLETLAPSVRGAAGIVNLEGPIGAVEEFDSVAPIVRALDKVRLVNAPGVVEMLARAGVAVVGVANNHVNDLGPESAVATVRALEERGLHPTGGVAGAARLTIGGTRVAVTAHDLERGVPATLGEEIAAARRGADLLICTFHVTVPPTYLPTDDLRAAVEIALAAGARVVASHGTHAIGPVERRGGAVIAWGLGNLAFACDCTDETDAILLTVRIAADSVEAAVIPIEAGLRGEPARPAPDPNGIFDLLEAIGSAPIHRDGPRGRF